MPLESPFPPLEIPDGGIWDLLFDDSMQQTTQSESVLFSNEDSGQMYTALEVKEAALRFARALETRLSFGPGDTLALVSANSVDMAPVIWGTLYLGGMELLANPGYRVEELQHQLQESGASVVVTQQSHLDIVHKAAVSAGIPHGRTILISDSGSSFVPSLSPCLPSCSSSILHFSHMVAEAQGHARKAKIHPIQDVGFLIYSSGTTGPPKGIQLTHRNIVANVLMADAVLSTNHTDVMLAFLPLFHIIGEATRPDDITALFTLASLCKTIEAHRVSIVYLVPPVTLELSQSTLPSETGTDLSSIRFMASAGAPLSPTIVHALYVRHGIKLIEGYGLSETSPGAFMMPVEDYPAAIGTVGRLLPGQRAKLIDVDNPMREVDSESSQPGEVCIRGPNVFKGYLNNPNATRDSFTQDGYFRTGDLGVFVEVPRVGTCLRITDRLKELIKYKGFQVAPAES
ncbi:hypothetical protein PG990_004634 [Apiospora arundinis]|uniref:4-coumarate-CoA ligase-like protein n=1 Tax=Apiospora arundinis TaxID=335852 RepID=A0ABR2J5Z3_9PEZI